MDLRFVSSLVLVIDAGSLAAAARVEGITPSAVAQRIAALEALLGVPLLVRAGRVMQPTPECRTLLPGLRQLLRDEQALKGLLHGDGHRRLSCNCLRVRRAPCLPSSRRKSWMRR
jgi:DNA-binding transcriptional LysR family regulator